MDKITPGDGSFLRALTSGPMTGMPGSRPVLPEAPPPAAKPVEDKSEAKAEPSGDEIPEPAETPATKAITDPSAKAVQTRLEKEVEELVPQEDIDKVLEDARAEIKTIPMPYFGKYTPYVAAGIILGGVSLVGGLVIFVPLFVLTLILQWTGLFDVSLLWSFVFGVVALVIAPISYFLIRVEDFLFTIKQGEAGVRRYFGEAVHDEKDGKPDYTPLATGLVLAPKPFFTVDVFELGPHTYDIPNTNFLVQHPDRIPSVGDDTSKESTIDFGGKFTLSPDGRDFRSLIRLRDLTKGIEKAAVRVLNALLRNMQLYCAGPRGPHTQREAVGMEQTAFKALKALSYVDIAESGVVVSSMTPSILPPKIQLDAINEMNVEGAERDKELAHAKTAARARAIILSGDDNMSDAEVKEVLRRHPMSPDLAAVITGLNDGTITPDSGIKYTKFDSGKGENSTESIIATAKEIWNGND